MDPQRLQRGPPEQVGAGPHDQHVPVAQPVDVDERDPAAVVVVLVALGVPARDDQPPALEVLGVRGVGGGADALRPPPLGVVVLLVPGEAPRRAPPGHPRPGGLTVELVEHTADADRAPVTRLQRRDLVEVLLAPLQMDSVRRHAHTSSSRPLVGWVVGRAGPTLGGPRDRHRRRRRDPVRRARAGRASYASARGLGAPRRQGRARGDRRGGGGPRDRGGARVHGRGDRLAGGGVAGARGPGAAGRPGPAGGGRAAAERARRASAGSAPTSSTTSTGCPPTDRSSPSWGGRSAPAADRGPAVVRRAPRPRGSARTAGSAGSSRTWAPRRPAAGTPGAARTSVVSWSTASTLADRGLPSIMLISPK